MNLYTCKGCGYVAIGEAPEKCPACGAPKVMFEQNDNLFVESAEKSKEGAVKHVPSIEISKTCGMVPENDCIDVMVRVGKTLHPMLPEHHISFIDCYLDRRFVGRALLTPAMNPAVIFHVKDKGEKIQIVEMCNLHGYWTDEANI